MNKKVKIFSCFLFVFFIAITLFYVGTLTTEITQKNNNTITLESFAYNYADKLSQQGDNAFLQNSFALSDIQRKNGEYYISGEVFAQTMNAQINKINGEQYKIYYLGDILEVTINEYVALLNGEYVPLENAFIIEDASLFIPINAFASVFGVEVQENDDSINMVNQFETKRIIVKSNGDIPTYNAEWVVSGYEGLTILQYSTALQAKKAYEQLAQLDNVNWVYADVTITTEDVEQAETIGLTDTDFSYKTWGATAIGANEYSSYLVSEFGEENLPEIVVAVLDTGIYENHSWFSGRIYSGGVNYTSTNQSAITDGNGHGTHVAGTIVDLTLKNVKILPIKVLDNNGNGYLANILLGIQKVKELKQSNANIKLINLSLGAEASVGTTVHTSFSQEFAELYNMGVLSVVAAGNDGKNASGELPANISNVITVGAVGKVGTKYYRASWSNYGSYIDVSAPGVDIVSAYIGGVNNTKKMNGTSMACPHVTGALALLFSDANANYTLSSAEAKLKENCVDCGVTGRDDYYGEGVIDLSYCFAITMDDVSFSHPAGLYDSSFYLTLSSTEIGATIYYTLDGTTPTTSSTLYTSPIRISSTEKVTARAFVLQGGKIRKISKSVTNDYIVASETSETYFTVDSEGVLISYTGSDADITVPEQINGITITAIGQEVFRASSVINSVVLPNTVTLIDKYAFYQSSVKAVYAPGVTKVAEYAFAYCSNFNGLTDNYFPQLQIMEGASFGSTAVSIVSLTNVTTIESYALALCGQLRSVYLPSVVNVGAFAFYNDEQLVQINMPSAKVLQYDCLKNCTSLETINLPVCEYIGKECFIGCSSLNTVDAPQLKTIAKSAFEGLTNLSQVNISNVVSIGYTAFYNCTALETIDLPNVMYIGMYAFAECSALSDVTLTKVQTICKRAFVNCDQLSQIDLPSIKYLDEYVFYDCASLLNITLSPCVVSIGTACFDNKSAITINYYANTVASTYVKGKAYTLHSISPATLIIEGVEGLSGVSDYSASNTITTSHSKIVSSQTKIYQFKYITTNAFLNDEEIEQINMANVKIVEKNAFKNCSNLQSVVLDNVDRIDDYAFYNCPNLTDVYIPNVRYIGEKAFYNCPNLTSITLGSSIQTIKSKALGYAQNNGEEQIVSYFTIYGIEDTYANTYAEQNNIKFVSTNVIWYENMLFGLYTNSATNQVEAYVQYVNYYATGIIIVPDRVMLDGQAYVVSQIGESSFKDCQFITQIILPETVETICAGAFENCYELEKINLDYITTLEGLVFVNCYKLQFANFKSLTTLNYRAIYQCYFTKIYLPVIEVINNANFYLLSTSCQLYIGEYLTTYPSTSGYLSADILTIYGPAESKAREFARDLSITFVALNEFNLSASYSTDFTYDIEDSTKQAISASYSFNGNDISYKWFKGLSEDKSLMQEINCYDYNLMRLYAKVGKYYYYCKAINWNGATIDSPVHYAEWTSDSTAQYSISATSSEGGEVLPSGGGLYYEHTEALFTFTVYNGYLIARVIIDGLDLTGSDLAQAIANEYYVFEDITQDHSLRVEFVKSSYTIYVLTSENGSISPSGDVVVSYGGSKTFTITPNIGYRIASIIIDGNQRITSGDLSSYTFDNVSYNHTIQAEFVIRTFTISANAGTGGTISPSGEQVVNYGSSLVFAITTNIGYDISQVLINGSPSSEVITDSLTINSVTQDYIITIQFAQKSGYSCVVLANVGENGGGTITPKGASAYLPNTHVNITFMADAGYKIASILVDGVALSENDMFYAYQYGYTFANISANHTIRANYEKITYTISISYNAGGAIQINEALVGVYDNNQNLYIGEVVLDAGDSEELTILCQEGYRLASFVVNSVATSVSNNTYSISNIAQDYTIVATFEKITFTISITIDGEGGSVDPSGNIVVEYGESVTFTITENHRYQLNYIIYDGYYNYNNAFQQLNLTQTISNIKSNHTIVIAFAYITRAYYTIAYYEEVLKHTSDSDVFVDGVYYTLARSFRSIGEIDATSQVEPQVYAGYTAKEVEQQTISENGDTVVKVYYNRNRYSVTIVVDSEGVTSTRVSGAVSGANVAEYKYGERITVTATIAQSHNFVNWLNITNESSPQTLGDELQYAFDLPAFNVVLKPVATIKTYTITIQDSPNGTISPNQTTYDYGQDATFTFSPTERSHLVCVWVDDEEVGEVYTYTFENIRKNHTLYVYFKLNFCNITINNGQNGTYSCTKSLENITAGETRTITITPNENYVIDAITINGENVTPTTTLVLEDIIQDMQIDITYKNKNVEEDLPINNNENNNSSNTSKNTTADNTLIYVGGGAGAVVALILLVVIFKASSHKRRRNNRIRKDFDD